ncbi:MAG: hypothetical protein IJJ40_03405 [Clostridia bacterium]|nr:hypothetical protein [Clostridia bacterium]
MLRGAKKTSRITASITREQENCAIEYIKGAVHDHCNNLPHEDFSVRIMFGSNNNDWNGTAIQVIYDELLKRGRMCGRYSTKDEIVKYAKNRASIDVGKLLKEVLINDRRNFYVSGKDTGKKYKLMP